MPVIRVTMWPRPIEQKRELAKAITDAIVRIAKAPPDETYVIFEDIEKENWAKSGILFED
ncbi:MAG: tautomerase family protein [Methanobacteriota archaeon]|nr:MAG: tautomerase family protein [Euryarchaeota archaeon]